MKKTIILFLFIFQLLLVNAQNWKPINLNEKYNYTLGSNNYYASIWIDSASFNGSDSVYFLNKIIKKIKNGDSQCHCLGYYLNSQSQFFLSSIINSSNGERIFNDTSNKIFRIKTNAQLNEQWVFDSISNDTARISALTTLQIFGNTDSVKIISLSSNDTIIISKNYGIIRFPVFDSLKQYVNLVGIEGRNLGIIIPKYFDFFNFNTDDVFCYQQSHNQQHYSSTRLCKIKILSKSINNDTLIYHTSINEKTSIDSPPMGPPVTYYSSDSDSIFIFVNNANSFLNKYPNQILNSSGYGSTYKPIRVENDTVFNTITKTYNGNPFCLISDTIEEFYNFPNGPCSMIYEYEKYGKDIGLIRHYYYVNHGTPIYETDDTILLGYIKNGTTYGTILSDSIFSPIGIDENNFKAFSLNIYPNPAKDILIIQSSKIEKNCLLTMCNISGQELIRKQMKGSEQILDISNLSSGLYFLKKVNDNFFEVRKIIKE